MFPVSLSVSIVGFLEIVIIGLAIGALSGFLVSIILKQRVQEIVKDALLGLIGFVIALTGFDQVTTTSRFQHPFIAAGIIAVIPRALHQWFRFKRLRSVRK